MKIKVTLSLEEEVWRSFRGECIKRHTLASELVEGFLRETLQKWSTEEEPRRKPKK
jgi:hypothetical protein